MLSQLGSKTARLLVTHCRSPAIPTNRAVRSNQARTLITSRAMYGGDDMGADAKMAPTQKAFAKFNIYKGKGAVQVGLIGPTWATTAKGGIAVDREGVLYLEFANVKPDAGQQTGYGNRSYNWEQKVGIALKPAELGNFLDDKLAQKGFDVYHDPDKGGPSEGMVKKTFSVKVNPDSSFMFTINQNERSGGRISVTVPVTQAEMAVIRNVVSYATPRLLGFDYVCDGMHVMKDAQ